MKIQATRNYAKDARRGAILVERPLAASETISSSEPIQCAPGNAARHYVVISYSRSGSKGLNRWVSPLAKIKALGAIVLLISAAAYLGSAAYREVQQARLLNEGQDRRLAQLEEQISRNSRSLSDLAQSNQDLLTNLSLPTKLSNNFDDGVCLISGSYIFIDPNTGLPLRGMKNRREHKRPFSRIAEVGVQNSRRHSFSGNIFSQLIIDRAVLSFLTETDFPVGLCLDLDSFHV